MHGDWWENSAEVYLVLRANDSDSYKEIIEKHFDFILYHFNFIVKFVKFQDVYSFLVGFRR
jgi:hypothetical protein